MSAREKCPREHLHVRVVVVLVEQALEESAHLGVRLEDPGRDERSAGILLNQHSAIVSPCNGNPPKPKFPPNRQSLRSRKRSLAGSCPPSRFVPDARTLATARHDKVRLWQAATGEELLVLDGHKIRVNAVAFSRDGQMLASASHDGAVQLWRTSPVKASCQPHESQAGAPSRER